MPNKEVKLKLRSITEAEGAHLGGICAKVTAGLAEGMRRPSERGEGQGEAVRSEGGKGTECRARGKEEQRWERRRRTQLGTVDNYWVKRKRNQRKRPIVQSMKEDHWGNFKHNRNTMKCGRSLGQEATKQGPLVKWSWWVCMGCG